MILGLEVALFIKAMLLQVFCDLQLIANQVNGDFEAQDGRMKGYYQQVQTKIGKFKDINVSQISRDHNNHVNTLACLTSALASEVTQRIIIE